SRLRRLWPSLARRMAEVATRAIPATLDGGDVEARLAAARRVFDEVDLFVSPSSALADEYRRLGVRAERLRVSDYGFPAWNGPRREREPGPLQVGFVGTLVWHKGAHVLVEEIGRAHV